MPTYYKKRNKTKQQITDAFWKLYVHYNYQNIMNIQEITAAAKVNRSTFYYYYQNTADILEELIEKLKDQFTKIFSSTARQEHRYLDFYAELSDLFRQQSIYLIPLVCESHHPEFAKWYRDNQLENFKQDLGLSHYRNDPEKNKLINIALLGLVEEQIQTFGYNNISIEQSFALEYGIMNKGLFKTLLDDFKIKPM